MPVRLPEERHRHLDAVDAGLARVGCAVEEAFGAVRSLPPAFRGGRIPPPMGEASHA